MQSRRIVLLMRGEHRRRINTEEKAKDVSAVWGTELIQFLAALDILHQADLEKRMNRITAAWQSRCFYDHMVHTTPNHHPTKMDVLSKSFLQIILCANWLVRHSSTFPSTSSDDLCLLFCLYPSTWRWWCVCAHLLTCYQLTRVLLAAAAPPPRRRRSAGPPMFSLSLHSNRTERERWSWHKLTQYTHLHSTLVNWLFNYVLSPPPLP